MAPLLIFRRDNIEQKLDEFANKYQLDMKKRSKLWQTVAKKMSTLQDFVPEQNELTPVMIKSEEF